MTVLTPNQIGVIIYWVGGFGPPSYTGVNFASDGHGGSVYTIPKPGSKKRLQVEHWLDTAIAIVLTESGGDTKAKNSSTSASGLWQVMVSLHKAEIDAGIAFVNANPSPTIPTDTHQVTSANKGTIDVFDPRVNTYAAAAIYKAAGFSWSPWESFKSNAYWTNRGHGKAVYAFLTNPANIQKELDRLANIDKTDHVTTGVKSPITSWIDKLTGFLAAAGITTGVFILGALLFIIGALVMFLHTKAGKSVKSGIGAASNVVPIVGAAKAVGKVATKSRTTAEVIPGKKPPRK